MHKRTYKGSDFCIASTFIKKVALVCFVSALSLVQSSCSSSNACSSEMHYGLRVLVKDAVTGDPICDAQVIAQDENYKETLQLLSSSTVCPYLGAGERVGHYTITISHAGYQSTTINITVGRDECHVQGEAQTVPLQAI